jgi:hypothetical protein
MSRHQPRGAARVMARHLPLRDTGIPTDTSGHWWCTCGLPAGHPVHDLPDTPDDITQAEARRYGEHDGEGRP